MFGIKIYALKHKNINDSVKNTKLIASKNKYLIKIFIFKFFHNKMYIRIIKYVKILEIPMPKMIINKTLETIIFPLINENIM